MIAIVIGLVVLLIAGGIGAYFLLQDSTSATPPPTSSGPPSSTPSGAAATTGAAGSGAAAGAGTSNTCTKSFGEGPIWSNVDAQGGVCAGVCSRKQPGSAFTGQWRTTVPGSFSTCDCQWKQEAACPA